MHAHIFLSVIYFDIHRRAKSCAKFLYYCNGMKYYVTSGGNNKLGCPPSHSLLLRLLLLLSSPFIKCQFFSQRPSHERSRPTVIRHLQSSGRCLSSASAAVCPTTAALHQHGRVLVARQCCVNSNRGASTGNDDVWSHFFLTCVLALFIVFSVEFYFWSLDLSSSSP